MHTRRSFVRRTFAGYTLGAAASPALGAARTTDIDQTLRSGIASRMIPNAVGMVANAKETLYQGAFGVRDNSGVPVHPDSMYAIASMTKAVTTAAAMRMVEAGKISLDEPVGKFLPKLASPQVVRGFDATGAPILSPARTPITLKHLLTHTSGLCYSTWDAMSFRFSQHNKTPEDHEILMFEPGTRWQYGTGLDYAGRLVEKLSGMSLEDYFQSRIFKPLGMNDTSYILPASKFDRAVTNWTRQKEGKLKQAERRAPGPPKEFNGGGGLYSTAGDYVKFMQMFLDGGRGVLKPATVASMEVNQIGAATAGKMKSFDPAVSADVDIQPGHTEKWGLGFLINTDPYAGGRSAGSLAWAGLFNTFYWIDVKRSICAVLLMQFLPFVDREAVGLLNDFEQAIYRAIQS